ncbi:heavy metal translocating P-type ATPase [Pseudenhygromyxa sp. WMMC2535]|uniref:heavy metal translocating P-type ATPase n=1 Tax=Pseudenhygromyxa sp. WMMC2535 TaxID=2712867 RepID=UPI0015554AB6|nr:heavy metal translocating P-type ATPase [Pseudenhygromyxa sp. WMMC2535]NVB40596.1 heavy metal translocating P-type ATPase [Pseudenhygromyxa sp. WMMC2535]
MTVPCAHCGLPAPAGSEGEPSFCCRGCRAAWELVHQAGLTDYYALRERLGDDPGAARAETAADEPAYAHLDDPEVMASIAQTPSGPGRAAAELHIVGLHCAACVWLIERLPAVLEGVESARVDFGSARLRVEWDAERVRLSQIADFLHRAGYQLHALDAQAEGARRSERRRELIRLAISGASAGNVMLVGFALHAGSISGIEDNWSLFFSVAGLILALPAVTWGALPFYRAAVASLRLGRLHIDLPIALGVAGGFLASAYATFAGGEVYFDSVTILVFLLLVGRWIQRRGQSWALSQTDLLQLLIPARARRRRPDGALETCAAASLEPGERVQVRPGERVPVDGTVLSGHGSVDASSLTGESMPLSVEPGSAMLAGTTLLAREGAGPGDDGGGDGDEDGDGSGGAVEIEVEAVGAETRVGSLAARIMEADRARAPIQRAVDRVSSYFVAAVLLAASLGGLAWWFIDPSQVFEVVVSLLVISCPCALGLATPVALAVARGRAAQRGILFASAGAIEALARVQRLVFDKTGTLTEGAPAVRSVATVGDDDDPQLAPLVAQLPALLALIEGDSGHPSARALRRWADEQPRPADAPDLRLRQCKDLLGRGREATVEFGQRSLRVRLGSLTWIDPQGSFSRAIEAALERAESPLLVEVDGRPLAMLSLADPPRDDAPEALAALRDMGLSLAIRSGDHPRVVAAVGQQLGVDDVAGALSPEDKARELAAAGSEAAMIGDGVNDAPALRAAAVGIAVRGGAEIALRVADVHLARGGVGEVAVLLQGARRTMALIRRNLGFSLVYNLLFASLALAGYIDPLAAALLMPASSLTVLLSSVLAKSFSVSSQHASRPFQRHAQSDAPIAASQDSPTGHETLQSLHSPAPVQPTNSL